MEIFKYFIAFINIAIAFFMFPGIVEGIKAREGTVVCFLTIMVFTNIASAVLLCK